MNNNLNSNENVPIKRDEGVTEISEDSFKNLQNACLLGMDIGGSLIKIAYSSSYDVKTSSFSEVFYILKILFKLIYRF